MPPPPELPDDVATLRALLASAQVRIGELEDAAASQTATVARRDAEIEYLKLAIAKLQKLAFGRKSREVRPAHRSARVASGGVDRR